MHHPSLIPLLLSLVRDAFREYKVLQVTEEKLGKPEIRGARQQVTGDALKMDRVKRKERKLRSSIIQGKKQYLATGSVSVGRTTIAGY